LKPNFKYKLRYLLVFSILITACAFAKKKDSLLDYSKTAELQFIDAMDDFDDRDCTAAEPKFQDVRKDFPYSSYAVLAGLRIADCQFIQGNHAEASILFEQFLKGHPTHEDAHYAAYKKGLCYYEMIPSDIFVMPPSHERDQSATRDARMAFSQFLRVYQSSSHRESAIEILSEVVDALVRHEIYVARFYLRRDDRRAAAVRLEKVRVNFAESTLVPDAMFLQSMIYLKMDKVADAKKVLNEIITYYPKHYQSQRAKEYLYYLGTIYQNGKRGSDG